MRGEKKSKSATEKSDFYLPILSALKETTNLSKIAEKLNTSKQNLNFYLRRLEKNGFIKHNGRGWYEIVKSSKSATKYGILLSKDISRGHAYVWNIKLPKEIKDWSRRIEILKEKDYHFELVGALKTTPRIKVLGRKVWLCNDHLRIFERSGQSYYGKTAVESRKYALQELLLIVSALENKLGVFLRPFEFTWQREHYALIKNDLAIDQNRKGVIWRIADQTGEWLIIDDSLGEGGELENIGRDSFKTNIPMQKWWNDKKEHGFKITDTFILEGFNKVLETQVLDKANIQLHQKVLNEMNITLKKIQESLEKK